jgi:hypothetical protein
MQHYSGTCGRRGGSKPSLKPKKRKPLLQVCLQSRGRLLKGRNRQGLGQAQVQIVGVTTDGAMSAPGSAGQALDLAMSGQTTMFSHKTKRRKGCQPGKPLRGIEPCVGQSTT